MKTQSDAYPDAVWIRRAGNDGALVKLRQNVEQVEIEDDDGVSVMYEYDEVETFVPKRPKLHQWVQENFAQLWANATADVRDYAPLVVSSDKTTIAADGEDTALVTATLPDGVDTAHVLINSPPPVYEVVNDGVLEVEFRTVDAGHHVIEVAAGMRRGLVVIEGVAPNEG